MKRFIKLKTYKCLHTEKEFYSLEEYLYLIFGIDLRVFGNRIPKLFIEKDIQLYIGVDKSNPIYVWDKDEDEFISRTSKLVVFHSEYSRGLYVSIHVGKDFEYKEIFSYKRDKEGEEYTFLIEIDYKWHKIEVLRATKGQSSSEDYREK